MRTIFRDYFTSSKNWDNTGLTGTFGATGLTITSAPDGWVGQNGVTWPYQYRLNSLKLNKRMQFHAQLTMYLVDTVTTGLHQLYFGLTNGTERMPIIFMNGSDGGDVTWNRSIYAQGANPIIVASTWTMGIMYSNNVITFTHNGAPFAKKSDDRPFDTLMIGMTRYPGGYAFPTTRLIDLKVTTPYLDRFGPHKIIVPGLRGGGY